MGVSKEESVCIGSDGKRSMWMIIDEHFHRHG
jgi:hypothetical protein